MIASPTEMNNENICRGSGTVIKMDHVGKKYPLARHAGAESHDFWALKDISFEIVHGRVLGIIGRNGAGKTTLLNAIAGVLSPTEGEITVAGKVLGLFNLGVGFQDELTGKENVFLNGTLLGASKEEIGDKFSSILDFSELGEFIDMPMGTYSQGMRLRLAFSIVANLDFEVLIMDEVLAVGDALFQSKCYERLMDFKRGGKTLVLTTQSMDLIERLCDEVLLLDHGKLTFSGSPVDAANKYRALLSSEQFYVGLSKKTNFLIENTKKWTDDISEWGKKLGTRETIIKSVDLINRWGFGCKAIKSRESFKIRVFFNARNVIKEPHFGVAIFRKDGVYCYGPNTVFDQHVVREIKPGEGWFELQYRELLLGPGEYKISVAIWDKNETLPFDYHSGYYDLQVVGPGHGAKELLSLTCKVNGHAYKAGTIIPVPNLEADNKTTEWDSGIKIISAKWVDGYGIPKDVLRTREAATLKIDIVDAVSRRPEVYLWAGLFRDDDVYCQGFVVPLEGRTGFNIHFPELPLLPGGYKVTVGVWDGQRQSFLVLLKNAVSLKMVFDREDHGTVHLKHVWKWGLPE